MDRCYVLAGIAWMLYAILAKNQLKVRMTLEFDLSDFKQIHEAQRPKIKDE